MKYIFLDFESRSEIPLDVRGLDNYVKHPSTQVLMLGYAFDDGSVKLWKPGDGPMPANLRAAIDDPEVIKVAWNAGFERNVFQHVLGIWIPYEQWLDPATLSKHLSMPGGLEDVGEIIGLKQDQAKNDRGKELIKIFCEPATEGGEQTLFGVSAAVFRDQRTDPVLWAEFEEYCRQDVVAERAILKKLAKFPLPEIEMRGWYLDQKINDRGVPTDQVLIEGAAKVAEETRAELQQKLKELTGLDNPNSGDQMKEWLATQGYTFGSLGKAFVARAMRGECELTPLAQEVLEIRKTASKTSWTKLLVIRDNVSSDGYLRNQFNFLGAARSGRWGSRAAQLHNLSRPSKEVEKNTDRAIELLQNADTMMLGLEFSSALDVVTSCIRPAFRAPEGKRFDVCDLNAIENRVLGWVARCDSILKVFRDGLDPYVSFAVFMYDEPYEVLIKDKDKRQQAKPAVLGCFGADTPVLTNRGWVPITAVNDRDQVFDGVKFVSHDGVLDQGRKMTIPFFGLRATPDHLIMTGGNEWRTAWDVSQDIRYEKKAIGLVNGLCSTANSGARRDTTISAGATVAAKKSLSANRISNLERQSHAFLARTNAFWKRKAPSTLTLAATRANSLIVWQTDTTPSYPAAAASVEPRTDTAAEASVVNSSRSTILLGTRLPWKTTTVQNTRLIGKTTTATMCEETFGSYLQRSTTETRNVCATLNGKVKGCQQRSSGKDSAQFTDVQAQLSENSATASPRSKSLMSSQIAEVLTFDIRNAGPRNRYMILTNRGPLLVHNCGYGLGGGDELPNSDADIIKTGLWGYSAAMGIEMTRDEAHRSVQIFRETYPEVVQFWYDLEHAGFAALRGEGPQQVGPITMEVLGNKKILRMGLPSGRSLHYIQPKLEWLPTPWDPNKKKLSLTYMGLDQTTKQWTRIKTRGAHLTENAVQAIARDLLLYGMLLADERGMAISAHVHDEIVVLSDNDPSLPPMPEVRPDLRECMTTRPAWAPDLPLGAEGYSGQYYKKG